jgi:hypothetical protein
MDVKSNITLAQNGRASHVVSLYTGGKSDETAASYDAFKYLVLRAAREFYVTSELGGFNRLFAGWNFDGR